MRIAYCVTGHIPYDIMVRSLQRGLDLSRGTGVTAAVIHFVLGVGRSGIQIVHYKERN